MSKVSADIETREKKIKEKMKFLTPQGDRLILLPLKEDEKTQSGLHLGGISERNPPFGRVLATGPDVKLKVVDRTGTRDVAEGDIVYFDRMTEVEYYVDITDNETKTYIIFARNVIMTLPGSD